MGSLETTPRSTTPILADTIIELRIGKVKPSFKTVEPSGINKIPRTGPVKVDRLGLDGDERSYRPHRGPDNALMHYASQHYQRWRAEFPENAHLFAVGSFGENIVTPETSTFTEKTVCIGDVFRIGSEVQVQVTKPRMPCYKLSHQFGIKDMNVKSQSLKRTGWYYRILKSGLIKQGDGIVLVERKYPQWTIAKVLEILYKDQKNEEAMTELAALPEIGQELKTLFRGRIAKLRSRKAVEEDASKWKLYRLRERKRETPRIASFIFEAVHPINNPRKVEPGSHVRVKLGADGKVVRAYSVVSGNSNRFELGVSFDEGTSKGGSRYLHKEVALGSTLLFSEIRSDMPVAKNAERHILIAGGVGITAVVATAQYLHDEGLPYHLYYAIRSQEEKAFARYLDAFRANVSVLVGQNGQRVKIPEILAEAGGRTHICVCGPDRLMKEVTETAQTLNLPEENIHFEAFAAATSGEPFQVEISKTSGRVLDVKAEETLLDVLRDAGMDVPSSCEVGNCGTCRVSVREGKIEHRGTGLTEDEKRNYMLSCVSRGVGKISLFELR